MVKTKTLLTRGSAFALSAALAVAGLVPGLLGNAKALIINDRSITMSTSEAAATGVTYHVEFDLASNHTNIEGIVVEFCDETPIIMDTVCTAPAGFTIGGSPTVANFDIGGDTGLTWTYDDANSGRTLLISDSTGVGALAAELVTFDITGVTNPNLGNYSFYARIYTYTDSTYAVGYTLANPDVIGAHTDDGGVALSTANRLKILTKVQERLTFCLYADGTCDAEIETTGAARVTEIYLGDTNNVLDPGHSYVNNNSRFDIATNASGGAVVYMKGATLTNSVSDTITAMGSAVDNDSDIGTEEFGMCAWASAGAGTLTIEAPYDDTTTNCDSTTNGIDGDASAYFAFDDTSTASASGDLVASKTAGTTSTARMAYLANIAWATEAGIYTTYLTFIATGTY